MCLLKLFVKNIGAGVTSFKRTNISGNQSNVYFYYVTIERIFRNEVGNSA